MRYSSMKKTHFFSKPVLPPIFAQNTLCEPPVLCRWTLKLYFLTKWAPIFIKASPRVKKHATIKIKKFDDWDGPKPPFTVAKF
jgi:hypothetical protein